MTNHNFRRTRVREHQRRLREGGATKVSEHTRQVAADSRDIHLAKIKAMGDEQLRQQVVYAEHYVRQYEAALADGLSPDAANEAAWEDVADEMNIDAMNGERVKITKDDVNDFLMSDELTSDLREKLDRLDAQAAQRMERQTQYQQMHEDDAEIQKLGLRQSHIRLGPRSGGNGTSLAGYVDVSYDQLVKKFGQPQLTLDDSGDGKVSAEWVLTYKGHEFTVYDYKDHAPKNNSKHKWHVGASRGREISDEFTQELKRELEE